MGMVGRDSTKKSQKGCVSWHVGHCLRKGRDYTRYYKNAAWAKLALAARTAQIGLWADKQPVAP